MKLHNCRLIAVHFRRFLAFVHETIQISPRIPECYYVRKSQIHWEHTLRSEFSISFSETKDVFIPCSLCFQDCQDCYLLTLCCSLVGVAVWFTFARVGTEIRPGERLNLLECSLWQQINVWWKKARKWDSRFLIDMRNFVKSLMLKKCCDLDLCYFRMNNETFFFQLMVSLSSDKNCQFCEMTETAKSAQECRYFSMINFNF